MSCNTQYELELPPYEVCVKTSYTKENIEEFKIQLQNIEDELLNIKSNDIRKPQLRRQAADLEEIIINFENTKPIPEIVQSLNDNIELLNEYVDLEKNVMSGFDLNQLNANIFTDDINWPIRTPQDFNNKIISKKDTEIFINHLKYKFPKYSTAIEIYGNYSVERIFSLPHERHNYNTLLNAFKEISTHERSKADSRRCEIQNYNLSKTQLSFNKKLSSFIENIIDEKKQMEDKIIELENKVNKLIRLVQYKRAEDESNFENLD